MIALEVDLDDLTYLISINGQRNAMIRGIDDHSPLHVWGRITVLGK